MVTGSNLFSFGHFNIRSCGTGFDSFSDFLSHESLDIVGLSETWLNENITDLQVKIDG